jgi:phage tail-like protein
MRGVVEGLATPYPLSGLLPAFLQEDEFTVRLTEGFDAVIAPLIAVLDCIDAYVDPLLAPEDFVPWLASWVDATVDGQWEDRRVRESILAATAMHRVRGTTRGLQEQLELATGGVVTVEETGGSWCSTSPTETGEEQEPALVVRIVVDDVGSVRQGLGEVLVDRMKPAHVAHLIEVVGR